MNVLELLRGKGIESREARSGEFWSSCPGCGGTIGKDGLPSNRFHVWPDQNGGTGAYWCRQCEKGGDNIQFLIDFEGKDYQGACKALGVKSKFKEQWTPRPTRTNNKPTDRPGPLPKGPGDIQDKTSSNLWREKALVFVNRTHEYLLNDKAQRRWLATRGINEKSIVEFKLGWNPGKNGKDLFRPRESWGLPTEIKDDRKKRLWLPIGLTIPHISRGGEVLRIRVRRPKGEPRYYVFPGSSVALMIKGNDSRAFAAIESELDMILVYQEAGDLVCVIGLGTAGAKKVIQEDPVFYNKLAKSAIILLSQDYDEPGAKSILWWKNNFPSSKRWPVPDGGDPGEAFKRGVDIRAWIEAGLPRGWFFGPSLLERKQKGGGVKKIGAATGSTGEKKPSAIPEKQPSDVPESIKRLAEILKKHPIKIINTPDRLAPVYPKNWEATNWETSKEVSNLIYFDQGVFEWLAEHPAGQITWKNIF